MPLSDRTDPYYRLADIHIRLDPSGTSLKSTEELVAELQAEREQRISPIRKVLSGVYLAMAVAGILLHVDVAFSIGCIILSRIESQGWIR